MTHEPPGIKGRRQVSSGLSIFPLCGQRTPTKMKVCAMLVFCLAVVISVHSHPVEDVSTAKTTSVTSKDGASSDPVPPHVSPLSSSASSISATKVNPPGSLDSSESESKESEERKTSTTAKSLFRRQADDQSESDGDDDGDDDSDGDEEEDGGDTRSRRQLSSSQSDLKGSLSGQGIKSEDQQKDDQQTAEKVPPPPASYPKY